MTERERELLLSYIVAEDFRIDDELRELTARLRTRRVGIEDCFELALALQRRESFDTFALVVLRLLKLTK